MSCGVVSLDDNATLRATEYLTKTPVASMGNIFQVVGQPSLQNSQNNIGNCCCSRYLPEFKGKTLLLKTPPTLDTGLGGIKQD